MYIRYLLRIHELIRVIDPIAKCIYCGKFSDIYSKEFTICCIIKKLEKKKCLRKKIINFENFMNGK